MKKVIIGSKNEIFHREISQTIRSILKDVDIINLREWANLINEVRTKENTVLVCDKFFLGLKNGLRKDILTSLNCELKIAVLDYGTDQIFLGFRLYDLGFSCFLNEIEKEKKLYEGLNAFFTFGKYYPPVIREEIDNGKLMDIKEYLGDVTDSEIEVGIKKSIGMSSKEIDVEHPNRADLKYHRFIRKTGYTRNDDMKQFLNNLDMGDAI